MSMNIKWKNNAHFIGGNCKYIYVDTHGVYYLRTVVNVYSIASAHVCVH